MRFLRNDRRDESVLKKKREKVFSFSAFSAACKRCYMRLYIFLDYARGTSVYSFSSVATVIVKIKIRPEYAR